MVVNVLRLKNGIPFDCQVVNMSVIFSVPLRAIPSPAEDEEEEGLMRTSSRSTAPLVNRTRAAGQLKKSMTRFGQRG